MKTCKGCGAFYEIKCQYCGYKGATEEIQLNKKYVTLIVKGSMNDVNVKLGECTREVVKVEGSMQNSTIFAEYINIEVSGSMNDIKVAKGVKYFTTIKGSMNDVKDVK